MSQAPYYLDNVRQTAVLNALRQHCQFRGWNLLAAHVRTNHAHVVVEADVPPEKVLNEFKSYASRALNQLGLDPPDRKRWARHGSTRWLFNGENVREAIRYVVEQQGEPMAVFLAEPFGDSKAPLPRGRGSLTSHNNLGETTRRSCFDMLKSR